VTFNVSLIPSLPQGGLTLKIHIQSVKREEHRENTIDIWGYFIKLVKEACDRFILDLFHVNLIFYAESQN